MCRGGGGGGGYEEMEEVNKTEDRKISHMPVGKNEEKDDQMQKEEMKDGDHIKRNRGNNNMESGPLSCSF